MKFHFKIQMPLKFKSKFFNRYHTLSRKRPNSPSITEAMRQRKTIFCFIGHSGVVSMLMHSNSGTSEQNMLILCFSYANMLKKCLVAIFVCKKFHFLRLLIRSSLFHKSEKRVYKGTKTPSLCSHNVALRSYRILDKF